MEIMAIIIKEILIIIDRLGTKVAGNIEMSVVPLRGPRTPAVSLALSDWSGVGDWSALKCAKASVNCLANYFVHHLHSSCAKHLANLSLNLVLPRSSPGSSQR